MSVSDLAFACRRRGYRVSPAHLGAIERGMHRPSVDLALTLAEILEVDVRDLFQAPAAPEAA